MREQEQEQVDDQFNNENWPLDGKYDDIPISVERLPYTTIATVDAKSEKAIKQFVALVRHVDFEVKEEDMEQFFELMKLDDTLVRRGPDEDGTYTFTGLRNYQVYTFTVKQAVKSIE